jgi:hypothetical protein
MAVPNIIADFNTTLALKVNPGDTTATLSLAIDDDGVALPAGTYGFTIDRKNSSKEYIICTLSGTSLTNVSTISRGTGAATSGFAKIHRKGAEVIISDFVATKRLQDIFETGYASAYSPSTALQLATKKYVDDLALGGTTTVDKIVVVGICGENVVAGNLIYLKTSDSKWWKCSGSTLVTLDGVTIGIAQGTGSTGGTIASGVLVTGVDPNQTGMTPNSLYYASDTAGAISATPGTNSKVVGIATANNKLYFNPNLDVLLSIGQKLALAAGSTFGTPSATNKFMTQNYEKSLVPVVRMYGAGTQTWSKPTGLKYIEVEVQAGGAGGGNSTTNSSSSSSRVGSGGGGGGYSKKFIILASALGDTETVQVGGGGGSQGAGGASNFGAHLSATGGSPGATAGNPGGDAGVGSGGDINLYGGCGQGIVVESTSSSSRYCAGFGGSSFFSPQTRGVDTYGGGYPGVNGVNYGGGGAGGADYNGGAAGVFGIIIIKEYYY